MYCTFINVFNCMISYKIAFLKKKKIQKIVNTVCLSKKVE